MATLKASDPLVDWARVGAGIHHPTDVIGSTVFVALGALIAVVATPLIFGWITPFVPRSLLGEPPPGIEAEAEGRLHVSLAIVAVQSELAILIVIGVGMMGAVTERSFIDLAVGTAVLANFGSATVAIAEQVRHLEHLRRVRYYCLAISPRSWRMVWTRQ